ncbi:MAG: carbamoyltransferase HypF, partial [Bacteroidia bacterium]|nr:carbamoyltransferase HypF [Bacteroidia bacterium]
IKVLHHEAHFYAILGEHGLLESKEEILGVVWDGTGLGDDQQIWGGEFFKYKNGSVTRLDHLPYFSLLAGDKMAREPRIAALSLLHQVDEKDKLLKHRLSDEEWDIYMQILQNNTAVKCSSMGRFFDGMAALILDLDYQTYEGEAAMRLENAADNYFRNHLPGLGLSYLENENGSDEIFNKIILSVVSDILKQVSKELVAARFHASLADYIARIANKYNIKKLAFSGGVFQNAWLIDLIQLFLNKDHALYFHQAFSPNDENISFGQLMYYYQNFHNEIS